VVAQLKEKGSIVRGWLGVVVQPIDENLAKALGLDQAKGALVSSVVKDSPASKAGVEVGDVILTFNNKTIDGINKLPRIVGETPLNTQVDLLVFRKGKNEKLKVGISFFDVEDVKDFDSNIAEFDFVRITRQSKSMYPLSLSKFYFYLIQYIFKEQLTLYFSSLF
jgi:serine protease Do